MSGTISVGGTRAVLVVVMVGATVQATLLGIGCSGAVKATGDAGGGSGSSGGTSGSGGGSSGGDDGIVGEWELAGDAGGESQEAFFNADGTCGFIQSYGGASGTESYCQSNYTYSVSGDVLTVDELYDSGFSNAVTAEFSLSGDTLTLSPSDGGFSVTYTRVNANGSNMCQ
jgi:hypothetical protein